MFIFLAFWTDCDSARGVCIEIKACPREKIIRDKEECDMNNKNLICCRVARVRMPIDMFEIYG